SLLACFHYDHCDECNLSPGEDFQDIVEPTTIAFGRCVTATLKCLKGLRNLPHLRDLLVRFTHIHTSRTAEDRTLTMKHFRFYVPEASRPVLESKKRPKKRKIWG